MRKLLLAALLPLLMLAGCEEDYKTLPDGSYEVKATIVRQQDGYCPSFIIQCDKAVIDSNNGKEYTDLYSEDIPADLIKDGQKVNLHFKFTGETYQCGFGLPYPLIDVLDITKQ